MLAQRSKVIVTGRKITAWKGSNRGTSDDKVSTKERYPTPARMHNCPRQRAFLRVLSVRLQIPYDIVRRYESIQHEWILIAKLRKIWNYRVLLIWRFANACERRRRFCEYILSQKVFLYISKFSRPINKFNIPPLYLGIFTRLNWSNSSLIFFFFFFFYWIHVCDEDHQICVDETPKCFI